MHLFSATFRSYCIISSIYWAPARLISWIVPSQLLLLPTSKIIESKTKHPLLVHATQRYQCELHRRKSPGSLWLWPLSRESPSYEPGQRSARRRHCCEAVQRMRRKASRTKLFQTLQCVTDKLSEELGGGGGEYCGEEYCCVMLSPVLRCLHESSRCWRCFFWAKNMT